jgi:AcrR family transcriptional regulator
MTRTELSTRERMITSAALLVRERGARATSIDDVLAHSGAPRGSVYHHFPGGRDQLLQEATEYAGRAAGAVLEAASDDGPIATLEALYALYARRLERDDFKPGCPVVAVAIEVREDGDRTLQDAAGTVFAEWEKLLADGFKGAGVKPTRAAELATVVLATFEGALILARAQRDMTPLNTTKQQLLALVRSELPTT